MLNWGEKRMSSSNELRDVDMYVYVGPAGLLGRFLGRPLRLKVQEFAFVLDRRGRELQRVEVDAGSLVPQCEVYMPSRLERLPLSLSEMERVMTRTRGAVLNVPRYPHISYTVEVNAPEAVRGALSLRGETHTVECSKTIEEAEVVVRCPVRMSEFHVPPFKLWLGLFTQADTVEVETRIPAKALKL
ncbi:YceI-like domain containing protein [Novymonas esmeraldas]|uniref:YceI-like domain containing protein n=1 Tax=Novymonas esmeraldas TaxID=1808958 RepID=A0AAW0ETI8_9TRYP